MNVSNSNDVDAYEDDNGDVKYDRIENMESEIEDFEKDQNFSYYLYQNIEFIEI